MFGVSTKSSASTDHMSLGAHTAVDSSASRPFSSSARGPANYSQIMQERWQKANATIPVLDQKDILEDSPVFNPNKTTGPEHQHHPEFSQQCYLRLRR